MFRFAVVVCVLLSGCGGSDSSNNTSGNGNPDDTANQIIQSSVNALRGSWAGTYLHNDDGLRCEWDIRMTLENTHYANQVSSYYKGHVNATITHQEDNSSRYDCLPSGRMNLTWTAAPSNINSDSYLVIIWEWGDNTADFGQDRTEIMTPYQITHNNITGYTDRMVYPRNHADDAIINITKQ